MAKTETATKEKDILAGQQIEIVEDTSAQNSQDQNPTKDITFAQGIAPYLSFLEGMRVLKKSVDTAPTFTPKNFFEQIQFYENGATYRIYIYLNGTWRYVALT